MKKGLVLEGGAMRGLFTAGVIDVLMENNIFFDGIIGVSAGACFGCNYLTGQIGRCIRYNTRFAKDDRYCSIKSLLKTGDIYNAEFCYHTLPNELDPFDNDTFRASDSQFYIVATDIETGEPVYKYIDSIDDYSMEWIRASASMPVVSNIVEIDNGKYLDGGITDSIPIRQFEKMGYGINVTVLTQPRAYRKSKDVTVPLVKVKYKQYPNLINAMERRHIAYNEQRYNVFEAEKNGTNFVICPKAPLPISRICHDPVQMREAYEIGRSESNEVMPSLKRFLENNHN